MARTLLVDGAMRIDTPAGHALLTGRGPVIDLDLPPGALSLGALARRRTSSLSGVTRALRLTGLRVRVRIAGHRVATLDPTRSTPLLGKGIRLHPGGLVRALLDRS